MIVRLDTRTGEELSLREETITGWEGDGDRIYIYTASNGTQVVSASTHNCEQLITMRDRLGGHYPASMIRAAVGS